MKDVDTMTVSKVGQSTLPKWWRDISGLSAGGVVEVRPMHDGQNSIVLTPKPPKRRGAVGLAGLFASCPIPLETPERHILEFNPTSEFDVDGIAKRTDAQGFAPTKPLSREIPARRRKALSAGPLKQDRRAKFGGRV